PSGRSRRGGLWSEHRVAGECIDGAEATCADRVETYPRPFDIGKVRLLRANVITGNADGGDDDRDTKPIAHSRPHPRLRRALRWSCEELRALVVVRIADRVGPRFVGAWQPAVTQLVGVRRPKHLW